MHTMTGPVSLEVAGRQLTITHPDKVVFPGARGAGRHTKLDLVRYYLSVADGALRGVAGRPMILKRFVKGISEEAVFQKRAPRKRPDWVDVA
jgi:DNA primase